MSKGVHILVVDDDLDTCSFVTECLKKHQFTITTVHNGQQAIEKIKVEKYDLLLLDIMMPEVSGIDICHFLEENKTYCTAPVFLISALPLSAIKTNQFLLTRFPFVKEYIEKPFKTSDLIKKIKKHLHES